MIEKRFEDSLKYFVELMPSISTLIVKVQNTSEKVQFQFKSEDGTFLMHIIEPEANNVVKIELENFGIKLITN